MTKALLQQARNALLPYKSTVLREYTKVDAAIDALNAELAKPEPSEPEFPKPGILYIGSNGDEVRGYTAKELRDAVLQERENNIALKKILAIVCAYLPPDGISVALAMAEIIAIVDPGTAAKEIPA